MKIRPYILAFFSLIAILLYLYFLIYSLILFDKTLIERILSIILILINGFFIMHSLSYLYYYVTASTKYEKTVTYYFSRYFPFQTSVFIATFNESPDVLENTMLNVKLMCRRGNGIPYILDDSTDRNKQAAIMNLAKKYNFIYVHRENRRGYKAGALNDALKTINTRYFAVFDADQNPLPEFLTEILPIMEEDDKIALIQVPQRYVNNNTHVAKGANDIQEVFYNFITQGKSLEDSMFSCGSNVLYRTSIIKKVGGFDEQNVTEDLATSIKIHEAGYKTIYYNRPLASGEAPETLNSYFIQQSRWSQGSMAIFFRVLKLLFRRKKLTIRQKIGYLVTTSWYFVGTVNIIMLLFPLLFIFFNIVSIITPKIYIFILGFYIIFEFFAFSITVYSINKSIIPVLRNISLTFIISPVLVKSAFYALIGKRTSFKVTPKGDSTKIPIKGIWPNILMIFLTLSGTFYSLYRYIFTGLIQYVFNGIFLIYFTILGLTIFYYNK
ncbi:hypothetical protein SE19_03305 [Acidiplasma aeolicum]|uniref:Glycosyltransferase 2-like domain-containing protein n=1 Tax=Acidiplasma aeolicum TaxID=507754 RepID=A0A0P9F4Z5_9ARCH|nr:cellulose synthase catalytic subunit [Acidiplasma aeolicum]KPV46929.1 hypothetical protein SE19_03305 [Acidiplasma aeolicum]